MITKKNITKFYLLFLVIHLFVWTIAPSITNVNLPLDTIEALAWGSNLDWGFNKHPPFSAFATEFFFLIFRSNDWAYYLLSQIFVIVAFIYVWKLSNEILKDKFFALLSLIILEGIYFYNFTTPEFNVNISQLPFWALTVYYFWKSTKSNKKIDWVLFGIFSALGFLSKYLFIYILFSLLFYFVFYLKDNKRLIFNYFISIFVSLLILTPHFIWLYSNDFVTIFYALDRSNISEDTNMSHLINPIIFLSKQLLILTPFFIMLYMLVKKIRIKIKINKKRFFLASITLLPILLLLLTSIISGAGIRTMWTTPFYLFFGVLFIELYKNNIDSKKIRRFYVTFFIFFLISPVVYMGISFFDDTKRTDYPGKEISRLVQNKWEDNFINEIKVVVGDEWSAGNLSYHLPSRPKWINDLKNRPYLIKDNEGVIYTGNPKILKKICPGVFGTIKPVGYCMIGVR